MKVLVGLICVRGDAHHFFFLFFNLPRLQVSRVMHYDIVKSYVSSDRPHLPEVEDSWLVSATATPVVSRTHLSSFISFLYVLTTSSA